MNNCFWRVVIIVTIPYLLSSCFSPAEKKKEESNSNIIDKNNETIKEDLKEFKFRSERQLLHDEEEKKRQEIKKLAIEEAAEKRQTEEAKKMRDARELEEKEADKPINKLLKYIKWAPERLLKTTEYLNKLIKKEKIGNTDDSGAPILSVILREIGYVSIFGNEEFNEILTLLKENGTDFNAQDNNGNTTLHHCFLDNEIKISGESITRLLETGINLNTQNNKGETALMIRFCLHMYATHKKVLIEKGADVNIRDKESKTALYYASSGSYTKKSLDVLKLLIEKTEVVKEDYIGPNNPLSNMLNLNLDLDCVMLLCDKVERDLNKKITAAEANLIINNFKGGLTMPIFIYSKTDVKRISDRLDSFVLNIYANSIV